MTTSHDSQHANERTYERITNADTNMQKRMHTHADTHTDTRTNALPTLRSDEPTAKRELMGASPVVPVWDISGHQHRSGEKKGKRLPYFE